MKFVARSLDAPPTKTERSEGFGGGGSRARWRARRAEPLAWLRRRNHLEQGERWWRRRESNPRPKARRRGTLHACPLLDSRIQREEAAKTAEYQTRYVSPLNAEPPFRSQPV